MVALVLRPDPHLGTLIQALNCLAQQSPPFPPHLLIHTSLSEVAQSLYRMATAHFSMGVQAASIPLLAATLAQADDLSTLGTTSLDFTRLLLVLSRPESVGYGSLPF